ncbi:MAG: AhpC/TSA family protein [Marinifilaceae bacterium]|nr:AhpC/TSA family protein [Marinifilaceae bacterium]
MRKLFIAAMAATMVACAPSGYEISGVVTNPEAVKSGEVYLVRQKDGEALDTASLVDGKFTFKGAQEAPEKVMIIAARSRVPVILENGKIEVKIDNANMRGGDTYAKGTKLNDAVYEQNQIMNEASKAVAAKYQEINAMEDKVAAQAAFAAFQDSVSETVGAKFKALYMANADNMVGADVFNAYTQFVSPAEVEEAVKTLPESLKAYPSVQKQIAAIAAIAATAEGKMFTDFTIEDGGVNGEKVSFSDYVGKGKYVLVDFFASWCGPCKAEIPNIIEIYKEHAGDKFDVLGVAVWDKVDATKKAVESEGIIWPVIYNCQSIPTDIYGIKGIPQIMLIGPDGTIVARNLRGDAMKAKVKEVLSK